MRKSLKITLISGIALICLVYLIFTGVRSSVFSKNKICSNIIISVVDDGNEELITTEEVQALLHAKNINPIGKRFDKITTKEIEDVVGLHPMVRNVECYKSPSGEVQIAITQRIPILRVVGDENYYVDESREIMETRLGHPVYVPVFSGYITKTMAKNQIYDFASFLQKDEFWNNQIEQIHFDSNQKIELVPRVGDHIISLGTLDRFEQKLEKLRKFYLYGLNEIGWNHYSKIDLQYRDQVICTRK